MSIKTQIGIAAVLTVVAFAVGRYSVTQTTTTKQAEVHVDLDKRTHTETVITKAPDGTTTEHTVTDTTLSKDTTKKVAEASKTEAKSGSKLNISLLVGQDFTTVKQPAYGISVSRELIGPVTLGLWGMNNGAVGLSLGVNF